MILYSYLLGVGLTYNKNMVYYYSSITDLVEKTSNNIKDPFGQIVLSICIEDRFIKNSIKTLRHFNDNEYDSYIKQFNSYKKYQDLLK